MHGRTRPTPFEPVIATDVQPAFVHLKGMLMRRVSIIAFVAAAVFAFPLAASAQTAYALQGADVFAGPGPDYPVVASVGPGFQVFVQGCVSDYAWCDVRFGPNRGWVYAGDLGFPYRGGRVPIIQYGPSLGLPIIAFSLGTYWDRYYRGRPWYYQRNDWARRAPFYTGPREWRGGDHPRPEFRRYDDRRFEANHPDRRDFRPESRGNDRRDNIRPGNERRGNEQNNNFNRPGNERRGNEQNNNFNRQGNVNPGAPRPEPKANPAPARPPERAAPAQGRPERSGDQMRPERNANPGRGEGNDRRQ